MVRDSLSWWGDLRMLLCSWNSTLTVWIRGWIQRTLCVSLNLGPGSIVRGLMISVWLWGNLPFEWVCILRCKIFIHLWTTLVDWWLLSEIDLCCRSVLAWVLVGEFPLVIDRGRLVNCTMNYRLAAVLFILNETQLLLFLALYKLVLYRFLVLLGDLKLCILQRLGVVLEKWRGILVLVLLSKVNLELWLWLLALLLLK